MQQTNRSRHRHITSFQVISLGFLSVILLGSLLLMLPIATKSGQCTSFLDALFTATSAVCVTGLVVNDTATYWSLFGQGVILLLIQIGGMGIITIAIAIAVVSGRKIGLMQRSTMQEAISAPTVGGIVRRTQFIIRTTILIEIIGAVLLAPVFCRDFGFWKGIWYALFHSISAFCNAGFDLIGIRTPFSSLTSYSVQPIVNLVIMMLIIAGGIGFLTWEDIKNRKWLFKKYRMQSKVIFMVTGLLIFLPALYFFYFEFSNVPLTERVWVSLFQSVTPRTAGFNTADLTLLSEVGQLGARMVVARAARDVHAKFLLRNGADEIVYPERQLADWVAIRYSADHILDYIELDEGHAIFEISIPGEWIGKTIGQLDIRKKYNINIMALKTNDIMNLKISSDTQLLKDSTMLVLRETKHIQKCFHI